MELMITVGLVAILAALSAPSMSEFIMNERLVSKTNLLISTLKSARSEAIKRNISVIVCTSSNGTTCTGGNGEKGWIIYADLDESESLTNADEIIRVQNELENISLSTLNSITFNNRGFSPDSDTVLSICDDRGVSEAKAITLSKNGQSRSAGTPTC